MFKLRASRLDHRDEGPAAIYLGRARGALVDIILPYAFLCYGSRCASIGVSCARNCFFGNVSKWNFTTRDRQFKHGATIFCGSTSIFA